MSENLQKTQKRTLHGLIVLFLLVIAGVGISFDVLPTRKKTTKDVEHKPVYEAELHEAVNKFRVEHNLHPLTRVAELDVLAREYGLILIKDENFSHSSPSGGTLVQRLERAKITGWRTAGENLAKNLNAYNPPAEAVRGWQLSEGHRANLLKSEYNQCGVGVIHDLKGGYVFIVQVYLSRQER